MNSVLLVTTVGTVIHSSSVEALGWTLLHFAWQGTAVALVLAAFLAFGRRLSPQVRYAAGCAALSLMILGAGTTFIWHAFGTPREQATESVSIAATNGVQPSAVSERPFKGSNIVDTPVVGAPSQDALPAQNLPSADQIARAPVASNFFAVRPDKLADRLRPWLNWIVGFWGVGVGLLSLRLAIGWRTIRRLRRSGVDLLDPTWAEHFVALRARLRVSAPVRLLCSASANVPMVVGWLKPVILLPAGMLTGLSVEQIEALLLHELAHVRRHDYLVNLAQNIVETLFFYHPAVWWVSGQIRREREHSCDDLAAAACGTLGYAQALARLADLRRATPSFGIAANSSPLIERIRRLAGVDPPAQRTAGWLAITALVVLVTVIAVRPDAGSRAESQPKIVSTPRTGVRVTKAMRKIAGRVMDRDGKPIPTARLWWVVLDDFFTQREFTVEGATDMEGHFQMQAPSDWKPRPPQRRPADALWILAPGKDLKVVDATDALVDGDKPSHLVVHLERATDTTYQIKDSQGRPVIGALVEPWHFHTLGHRFAFLPEVVREALKGITDNLGRVRLHSLPRQEFHEIRVMASGFGIETLRLDGDDADAAERTIILRPTSRIQGRVVANDPQAVRGIKMYVETRVHPEKSVPRKGVENKLEYSWVRESAGMSIVTTDQAGRFVIPAIAEGRATIDVLENPASPALLPLLPEHFELIGGQDLDLEIPMERGVLIRGTVRTHDTQQPVSGAVVRVSQDVSHWEDVVSDTQGQYVAHVLPGQVRTRVVDIRSEVAASYTRTGDCLDRTVEVRDGAQPFELPPIALFPSKSLTIKRSAREIAGRVVDRDGKPVAAARLWWVVLAETGDRREFAVEATSDANGRFTMQAPMEAKPPQISRRLPDMLWILAPGKDLKALDPMDGLLDNDKNRNLLVRLQPATEMTYRISDADEQPIAGAVVEPSSFRSHGWAQIPQAIRKPLRGSADNAGRVRLKSLPWKDLVSMQITAPEFGTQEMRLDGVDADAAERTITLRQAGRIEGQLIAADPAGVRGIQMYVQTLRTPHKSVWHKRADGTTVPIRVAETDGTALITTDAAGRFVIPAIATGPAQILFLDRPANQQMLPRIPTRLEVTEGKTLQIDIPLEQSVVVQGVIQTEDTRKPVRGAELCVGYGQSDQADIVTSDAQGRYQAHVLPGPVHVNVVATPFDVQSAYTHTADPWDSALEVKRTGAETELPPILLAPIEKIEGVLIDRIGRPLANAQVSGIRGNRLYGFATTDSDGKFVLRFPKKFDVDSFRAVLADQLEPIGYLKIMRYRPLVLCADVSVPDASTQSGTR
jgi:beta-lactamase regulating signal transducer with metallopeptidase domain